MSIRCECVWPCYLCLFSRKNMNLHFDALATLKPDHACLIPARLHQIGNCKKNCRHGSGVMPVVGRKLEGTFLDYPHFDLLFPCFQSFFSLRLMFLQVSFKILVQTSRHWAGMSKETRLQNGEKISRDWSVSVVIWSSRCQCSQSIIPFLSCPR